MAREYLATHRELIDNVQRTATPIARVELLRSMADVRYATGDIDDAVRLAKKPEEECRTFLGTAIPAYGYCCWTLAVVETPPRPSTAGIQRLLTALGKNREILGNDHPLIGECHLHLGQARLRAGESADANSDFSLCLRSRTRVFGAKSPQVAEVLEWDALALDRPGQHDRALESLERAQLIRRASAGNVLVKKP